MDLLFATLIKIEEFKKAFLSQFDCHGVAHLSGTLGGF